MLTMGSNIKMKDKRIERLEKIYYVQKKYKK